ncbi:MAG TPA: hypothetical protein VMW21_01980 [Patescibacteria group bacterium]|nr:hypothetical protein [Patescibacteria group bacterium]
MSLSKKAIDEFKKIYKKEYKKELNDAEASEAANNLVGLFKILYDCEIRDLQRKHRLKKKPEGFHLADGIYNCSICHRQVKGDESWYDKWGIKCLLCQKAVKEGFVPPFVCKDRDSWYAMWELESNFGIKHPTARKLVRQGKLKARIVTYENGHPYEYVFLKKENPDLIDPDRKSPARKSYDRNYNKIMDARIREEKNKSRYSF